MLEGEIDLALFQSLEQALHRPEVRGSRAAVEALLADDFVEFGSSGKVYDRALVIDALLQEAVDGAFQPPEVRDFAARALASEIVLVTYCSVDKAKRRTVLRSSIWQQTGGNWRMRFHQGTVVPPE